MVAGGCLPQHSENTAVFDPKDLTWCTILTCARGFHEFQNVQTIHHLAEDHVLPIQLGTCAKGDVKLACVAVLSRVGHAHHPRGSMFQLEGSLFVVELSTVDRFSSRPVVVHKVASLANESFLDAKETATAIVEWFSRRFSLSLVTSDEGSKVSAGFGCDIVSCFDHDPAHHERRRWIASQLHPTIRNVVSLVSSSTFPRFLEDLSLFVVQLF
mmetsp:Transcript_1959/g.7255  ORF Transcript_1959/g.7255 Transcript_1959/m.7255 type:complete len:213 (+) Transcript_1959:3160-3798(+)